MDVKLLILTSLLGLILSLYTGLNETRMEKLNNRLKVLEGDQS